MVWVHGWESAGAIDGWVSGWMKFLLWCIVGFSKQ